MVSGIAGRAARRSPNQVGRDRIPLRRASMRRNIALKGPGIRGMSVKGEKIMHGLTLLLIATAILVGTTVPVGAQQPAAPPPPPTTPYGSPIDLDAAKKVMAAAEAEATKNNWPMAIVILDSSGHTVMLHKLDNTQYGSIRVAEDKAQTALDFRRPSKVFEDLVAQGGINMRILSLRGAAPLEGGVPILVDGKIIGAIGVSGGASSQDGQVAKAGADAASAK